MTAAFKQKQKMVIKSLGVVYGDIGTSPIYTLAVVILLFSPDATHIYGIVSLLFWTLTVLVTIQYAWLAMSLSSRGEGGTIVLVQLLKPLLERKGTVALITIIGLLGISLMMGDGVITPAISILSAVEGVLVIPGLKELPDIYLLIVACVIAYVLFKVQSKGVERVAGAFGPFMLLWFTTLLVFGIFWTAQMPQILEAFNPYHIVLLVEEDPMKSFVVLATVILCATGGEALYADMGHMGRMPILKGWGFVFIALILNYCGQAVFMLKNPGTVNPFFEMVHTVVPDFYILFLLMAVFAAIIASQAMISGITAVIFQAINTKMFPRMRVTYTSSKLRTQIYIGTINWMLFVFVLLMLLIFQKSSNLAAAYGLAVAGAMSITGVLMMMIFINQKRYIHFAFASLSAAASLLYFSSCWLKIPMGGYISLLIAAVPFAIIFIYTSGQERLRRALHPVERDEFVLTFIEHYQKHTHASGSALFFTKNAEAIPHYIPNIMFFNGLMFEKNILVVVKTSTLPHGVHSEYNEICEGLYLLNIMKGYMEIVNIEAILKENGINEKSIFYAQERIMPSNLMAMLYSIIKRLSPTFVDFHNLPPKKLLGVERHISI